MNTNTYGNFYTPYSQNPQFRYPEPQPTGLRGRPVSSIEEAKGSIIDFDGSVFFFPDLANQKIYTKQITADGTALLKMYELKEVPTVSAPSFDPDKYVTKEEFEKFLESLKALKQPQQEIKEVPAGSFSF
jgi:hypothetical protein